MSLKVRPKFNSWFGVALVFVWPFIYLFPYIFPIDGRYLQLGNDFYPLYYVYKVYLLSLLNSLHFPLWSPSEAAGYPFLASPFTQSLYPFNLPLVLFYHIAHGYTELDYQRFTVFGISIFAVGIYLWLRSLKIALRPTVFAALVMATSLKVVEITRFPNAVHTACWYPWILYAITKIVTSPFWRQKALFGILLVFSGFCLITGGYPYFLYYSLFLIAPYGVLILFPALRRRVFGFSDDNPHQTWLTIGASGVMLLLLSSFYLIQVLQLLHQTTDRTGVSFEFATAKAFEFKDTLGSLVYPPASNTIGWYHFGFVGLLLILLFLFGRLHRTDQKSSHQDNNTFIKLVFVGWLLLISYITYGKESILFALLWRVLPGFSTLREWGRMNIILVPIIAWLLALAYQYFEDIVILPQKQTWDRDKLILAGIWVLVGSQVVIFGIQGYFIYNRIHDQYWTEYFLINFIHSIPNVIVHSRWMPSTELINRIFISAFVILGILSFLVCLVFLLKARNAKPFPVNAMLSVFIALSVLSTFIVGPWAWISGWVDVPPRNKVNVLAADLQSFNVPRTNTLNYFQGTITLSSTFSDGVIPSWYFDRYNVFYQRALQLEPAAARLFLTNPSGQKIYFSSSISSSSIQGFLNDATRFPQIAQVRTYNGDFLDLNVTAPADGYISFIDNWDPNWRASVDGRRVDLLLLFGTFKSVRVSKGSHRVEFAYCPSVFDLLNPPCSYIR